MSGPAIDVAAWSSRWRTRSPGDKLLLAGGGVVVALVLPPWPAGVLVTAGSVALAVGPAGVDPRVLARAARAACAFIALGAVSLAVTWQPGRGFVVTGDGVAAAAGTTVHAVAGTSAMLLLATTTPVSDLLHWMRSRGVPEVVVDVAGLVYRLLFVLLRTAEAVRAAQAARLGYSSPAATMRSAAGLAAAVLTRAWSRARSLEEGLAGRGFDGPLRVVAADRPSSPRFVAASLSGLALVVALSAVVVLR
ncbi:MAG: cobalt/nickel transport system permease protein [Actinomycetota bacterium]|nr:cobalt/nickel transport system permease protein [Actinomycetota bacterium]